MPPLLRHYGWECSPYSNKTRAYLRYKQIPHQDISPSFLTIRRVMQPKVGFVVMPVVVLPDGTPLQDTSAIIDHLEDAFPQPSIIPSSPKQALVALLLELFADEWMPIITMHTRWNLPLNRAFASEEFGRCAFPWLPLFVSRRLTQKTANRMASFRSVFGITEETAPAIDAWATELLQGLDAHFAQYPYLLGGRPSIADFAFYGPLYAHVWRDPASRELVESRGHLLGWIQRMRNPSGTPADFVANDTIPEHLLPILTRQFKEQFPILEHTVASLAQWAEDHPNTKKLPRGLDSVDVHIGDRSAQRRVLTFQQWMLQRPLDFYHGLDPSQKTGVDDLLRSVGGLEAMQRQLKCRLTRENFRVVVER